MRAVPAFSVGASLLGGPKDHINIRISHSGSRAQDRGIPEIMVGRILMFMWSFGVLLLSEPTGELKLLEVPGLVPLVGPR